MDSTFYKILLEEHAKEFDWITNNCGLFVGNVYQRVYNKDFCSKFRSGWTDKESAWAFVKTNGGWEAILADCGLVKRPNGKDGFMAIGDVVIAEHALGIWEGHNAFFAGGTTRTRDQVKAVYHLKETL